MPNYMIAISEVCYKEFQNIKQQIKYNSDTLSDSDILKLIFQKIDLNKDFKRELQSKGKRSRGRSVLSKNIKNINMDNFEDLAKCPGCDHSIYMLKHSLREIVRIELHTHFDNCHNEVGSYKCKCGSTFDYNNAYLKHINICYTYAANQYDYITSKNDNSNNDKSHQTISIENKAPSRKSKHGIHQMSPPSDNIISPLDNNVKRPRLSILTDSSINNNSNNVIPPNYSSLQTFLPIANEITENVKVIFGEQNPANEISLPNLHVKLEKQISFIEQPLLNLICQCQQVFTDYNEYHQHTNNCVVNSISEYKDHHSNITELGRPSTSKNLLKDCVPNSEGKYECPNCPKSFQTLISLKQHYKGMHMQDSKLKCENCNKLFPWLTSYNYHIKKCHLV